MPAEIRRHVSRGFLREDGHEWRLTKTEARRSHGLEALRSKPFVVRMDALIAAMNAGSVNGQPSQNAERRTGLLVDAEHDHVPVHGFVAAHFAERFDVGIEIVRGQRAIECDWLG